MMININDKKLLIFDCDGVLFDSTAANIAYFNRCLEIGGYPPMRGNSKEKIVYMSTKQLIEDLFSDEEDIQRLYKISQEVDYADFIPLLIPLFDFTEVLMNLRKNYFLAIATNRGKSIIKLFKYFGLFEIFHFKISVFETKAKPAPDMLFRCAEYFDVDVKDSLFIGDAESDMQSAKNAGMDFLWIGNGNVKDRKGIQNVSELLGLVNVYDN